MILQEIYHYRYLLRELVLRDIRKKYRRSVLGVLWSILNPLLMMSVTAMVFSTLFRFSIENYPLYLLVGQIMFTFFSESTTFAMTSVLENGSLLKKIYIPKYLFPLSRVISRCINLLFTLPALVIILLVTGQVLTWGMLTFIFPLVLLFFFCIGFGLLLSTMVVYFRDVYHLYSVFITLLSFSTPVFYPEDIVPSEYRGLLFYNPLYYFVKAFRQSLYNGYMPDGMLLLICGVFTVVLMAVGLWAFKKYENHFILYI